MFSYEWTDQPVDVVSQDGAAALHCWLLPGYHHIVLVGIVTTHVQGGYRNPFYLRISIWQSKMHTRITDHAYTFRSSAVSKSGGSLLHTQVSDPLLYILVTLKCDSKN